MHDDQLASTASSHIGDAIADDVDPRLLEVISQLSAHAWAAWLTDEHWRLVWVSPEFRSLYVGAQPEQFGLGQHVVWAATRLYSDDADGLRRWLEEVLPHMVDSAADRAGLAKLLGPEWAGLIAQVEPQTAPLRWMSTVTLARPPFYGRMRYLGERVHDERGDHLGYLFLYAPDVPVALMNLLVRGDQAVYERMAELLEPARRPAAILFADLEGSGLLSRRLSSPAYFRLIRNLRGKLDQAGAVNGGILGKHAGDGVTAFFLADQLGTPSAAARAALQAAISLPAALRIVATEAADDGIPVDPAECRLRVSVHWGPNLYVGQVASAGRLEVTALGDEVNEAARIEQSAAGGEVLASKPLLELLDPRDADAIDVDPVQLSYRTVTELPGATQKAIRDAGTIAVAEVSRPAAIPG